MSTETLEALKPYPAYKHSGVPFLGEVPEHWDLRQLGRFGRLSKGNGGSKDDEVLEGVPCVRYGDIYTQHQFFIERSRSSVSRVRATEYTPVQYGDILFAGSGETIEEIGKSAVNLIESEACCGGDVILFRPSIELNARFMGYAADCPQSAFQKSRMGRGITVMHIYGEDLKYVWLALPPLPEQALIVRFLDYAARRIRRYIAAKEKLVRLLEEQKRAIVHRAVTGGLDPNVRLKPSGVESIGDVPEHWEVQPLCALARIKSVTGRADRELLSVYLDRGVIRFSEVAEKRTNVTSEDLSKYQAVDPGDFVLNNQQAWRGSVGVSQYVGIVSPAYLVLSLDPKIDPQFANLLLRERVMVDQYLICSRGVGTIQRNLYWPSLRRVTILLPPLPEQAAIVRFIDAATADSTNAIDRTRREIALLREYRTSLIANLVTGKLDVRQAATTLPDEVDYSEEVPAFDEALAETEGEKDLQSEELADEVVA